MTFDSFETRALATRRLRYAIAASLLVHLLVLWPGNLRVLTKDTPSSLHAMLRLSPQPSVQRAPPDPSPLAIPPAPTHALPVARPESPVLERPGPSSVPQTPVEPVLKPSSGPESVAVAAGSAAVPAAGSASSLLLTEASASGEAVDGLRGYRLAIATQARRFKRYPAQAMASGSEGSADIRIEVGSDGRPRPATVIRSSGHELLDRAALAMIDAGAQRARLPESLRGKTFAVVLPVIFNLDDE